MLFLLWIGLVATPAPATTFSAHLSADTLLSHSIAVVRGTVADIRTTDALRTLIRIEPATTLAGWQLPGTLVLSEDGGRYGAQLRWVLGAPEYRVGEEVVVFVAQRADGTLHTADLGMGKYDVDGGKAVRRLGGGAHVLRAGRLLPPRGAVELPRFIDSIRARRGLLRSSDRGIRVPSDVRAEAAEAFTYLGTPARRFDPALAYAIDENGQDRFGFASSRYAAAQAAAAWASATGLALTIGEAIEPVPLAGCSGASSVTFNDPADEITDLAACEGTLAVSVLCASNQTTALGGQVFRRLTVSKTVVNNDVGECVRADPCKLAELLTHELGHTLGVGHAADPKATMFAAAHFDRRCAALRDDDLAAAAVAYPGADQRAAATADPAADQPAAAPAPARRRPAATPRPDAPLRDAAVVAQCAPVTLAAGESADVQITVRNTGTATWTHAGGYRLGFGAPPDGTTWGMSRVLLDPAEAIEPGEEKTFSWTVTAPATPGTYGFGWMMLQEGVAWFGSPAPEIAVTVR